MFILLLQNPQAQTLATRLVAIFVNDKFDTEISIGGIEAGFLGTFYLKKLNVYDRKGSQMIGIKKVDVELSRINRFEKSISFKHIHFEGVEFMLRKYAPDEPGNFQYFLNHFISDASDTVQQDPNRQPWKVICKDLTLRNSHFSYENRPSKQNARSIDFNDIEISDLDLMASSVIFDKDTISANFKSFTFIEKSGFELKEFSGQAKFTPVNLKVDHLLIAANHSSIDLDLEFNYDNYGAFNDFITEVDFESKFRKSEIKLNDIEYFAQTMSTMTDLLEFKGHFKGTVNNITGSNFEVKYGKATRFFGTVSMNGLPDITETFIHADIKDFTSKSSDVESFALPGGQEKITVPGLLNKMGVVNVKGKFTGFYNDFFSNATFKSELGMLKTNIVLKTLAEDNSLSYNGDLIATELDAGALLSMDSHLGKTSFVLNIDGKGTTLDSLDLAANGIIQSVNFKGYNYRNITLDATLSDLIFEGYTSIKDENLDFVFNGLVDFNDALPRFDFHSTINHMNLHELQLSNRDSVGVLSTELDFNFIATSIDDISGTIEFDSTVYIEGSQEYTLDKLVLKSLQLENSQSELTLFSDFIDVEIKGDYAISQIVPAIHNFVDNYSENLAHKFPITQNNKLDQQIDFQIKLKETDPITELFAPNLEIAPETSVSGKLDLLEMNALIEAKAPWINISNIKIHDWSLMAQSDSTYFKTQINFDKVMLKEVSESDSIGVGIDSLNIITTLRSDTLNFGISWNDLSNLQINTGKVLGFVEIGKDKYYSAGVTHSKILSDGAVWDVQQGNKIISNREGLFLSDFNFINDTSSLSISGGISLNPLDSLKLEFKKLNISHIDQLIRNGKFDINGVINGGLTLVNIYTTPNLLANIQLHNLYFNKEELGTLNLKTNWVDSLSLLDVNLAIEKTGDQGTNEILSAVGEYYPSGISKNFDLAVKLKNLGTQVFNPFIEEFADIDPESRASGSLEFYGTYAKPVLSGKIKLSETQVLVKYLNTMYSAAGTVDIDENGFNVDGLKIYDQRGNFADCFGSINHNYFKDFAFDVKLDYQNFHALNTTAQDNELFFGDAYASGSVFITGPLNSILLDIMAKTDKKTNITIPISSSVSVSENDFIIFINNIDTLQEETKSYNLDMEGFAVNMELNVTPDAEIELFLPYNMGDIKGNGAGNIGIGTNSRGDFTMNGDYIISEGTFNFSFESLLKKKFQIKKGSKISWSGDPYDARVNMTATYDVTTSLTGLRLQTDSTAIRNKSIDVDCNIILQNSLFNPDISFSLDLKNVDDDTRQIIFAALDTTDQSIMSQQIISLIFIGSFSYTAAGSNIGASGFKMLSNQVSNWLSQISNDFDIGISYQPGTELTEDEIEVALKTQLFNDKLSIDGNFGVKGTTKEQNTSNVVGNINVEYSITDDGRFRIRAFNRANDISFLEDNAPYTQGVGIFYRKEFENFKDLLKPKSSKKKQKKLNKRNQQAVRNETEKKKIE